MTQPSYTYADKNREWLEEAVKALRALPLEGFEGKLLDMTECDAADFVDHAGEFHNAMQLAQILLKKMEEE